MRHRLILIPILALIFTNAAWADDWARPGWYAGVGGGAGFNFFNKYIEENVPIPEVTIDGAGSFNAKAGYRVWSWFALEAMYEGVYDSQIKVLGQPLAKLSTHSLLGNLKFIAPIKRFQPYLTIGPGAQYGQFRGDLILDPLDTSRWDFTLRFGVGLDFYITENWVVDLELAPSVRFKDYSAIPSASTDNVTMTLNGGVQYRF